MVYGNPGRNMMLVVPWPGSVIAQYTRRNVPHFERWRVLYSILHESGAGGINFIGTYLMG
jgi:hypothetical protein